VLLGDIALEIAPDVVGQGLHQRRIAVEMAIDLLLAAVEHAALEAKKAASQRQQEEIQLEQPVMPAVAACQPAASLQLQRQQQAEHAACDQRQAGVDEEREKAERLPQCSEQQLRLVHAVCLHSSLIGQSLNERLTTCRAAWPDCASGHAGNTQRNGGSSKLRSLRECSELSSLRISSSAVIPMCRC